MIGAVTAGVLVSFLICSFFPAMTEPNQSSSLMSCLLLNCTEQRGQKSRFQLFGGTVNAASRMESNGVAGKIQCSQATADLLIEAGKNSWISPREDKVHAKGIGDVTTYWISPARASSQQGTGSTHSTSDNESVISSGYGTDLESDRSDNFTPIQAASSGKPSMKNLHLNRLVHWNADLLTRQIKVILAKRAGQSGISESRLTSSEAPSFYPDSVQPRNEYCRIIQLPRFDANSATHQIPPDEIILEESVKMQLLDFVTRIGSSYHKNPFHNWEVSEYDVGLLRCKMFTSPCCVVLSRFISMPRT